LVKVIWSAEICENTDIIKGVKMNLQQVRMYSREDTKKLKQTAILFDTLFTLNKSVD